MNARILIVDDDEATCEFTAVALRGQDFDVVWRTNAEDALTLVAQEDFDAVVTDLNMADVGGLELCKRVLSIRPSMPVILVTAFASMEAAVGAIRAGAYDFITKPIDTKVLGLTVSRAVRHRRLQDEVKRLRQEVSGGRGFGTLIGESPPVRKVFEVVGRIADTDVSVLITGESGTGKELVARAIHESGVRREGPFLAINCAAVPPTLLESELFGHVKGAFTDAKSGRTGLFNQASGGTLFLDEIGEMPLEMQPKLLRALQEKRVRPVGGNVEVPFDARIVTATNRDLESEVEKKRFREDLYYRINVVSVHVPPLRVRGNDILLLAQYFVERFAARSRRSIQGISAAAAEKLLAYEWPGNVRELENCIERAVALTRFEEITVEDLPERVRDHRVNRIILSAEIPSDMITLEELERRYILKVLALVGGNKSRTAEILGLHRRTVYRMLEKYQMGEGIGPGEAGGGVDLAEDDDLDAADDVDVDDRLGDRAERNRAAGVAGPERPDGAGSGHDQTTTPSNGQSGQGAAS